MAMYAEGIATAIDVNRNDAFMEIPWALWDSLSLAAFDQALPKKQKTANPIMPSDMQDRA